MSGHYVEFNLCDVKPTAMFWCVVNLEFFDNPSCLLRRISLVQECRFIIAGAHGPGVYDFAEKLIRFLIHAHNRTKRIIWQLINIKDILHSSDEFRICYARDAPVFTAVRSKPVFFNVRRIASRLIGSSSMTFISSSSSRIVHLL